MEELTVQIQKPIIPPLVWNKEAVEAYVNEALESTSALSTPMT